MLFEIRIYVWPTVFDKGQYSMEKSKFRNLLVHSAATLYVHTVQVAGTVMCKCSHYNHYGSGVLRSTVLSFHKVREAAKDTHHSLSCAARQQPRWIKTAGQAGRRTVGCRTRMRFGSWRRFMDIHLPSFFAIG